MGQFENLTAVKPEICVSGHFRDVSSVELLMNNHQGIKAEIDARNDSFTTCIELGKSLLARKHYASEEVPCSLHAAMGSWGFFPWEKPALCHPQRNKDKCHLRDWCTYVLLGNQGITSLWEFMVGSRGGIEI